MSDTAQVAITHRHNGTHPKYTPFNYELAVLGSIALKGFLVIVCTVKIQNEQKSDTTSRAKSFFTWIYRNGCEAVAGGRSLDMVLVSYSSAIK